MKTLTKFVIACILVGCIFSMPCIYFDFVLTASCIAFSWFAFAAFKTGNILIGMSCTAAAILYNPVFKINFTRIIWNDIDMFLATMLLLWIAIDIFIKPNGTISRDEIASMRYYFTDKESS